MEFTREELKEILTDVMNLGLTLRQDQLNGSATKSGDEVLKEYMDVNFPEPNIQIVYMDGFDEVRDLKTQEVIFSTKTPDYLKEDIDTDIINPEVIDNVVNIWNKTGNISCLGSEGELDKYLLDEGKCYQEEREIIVESLYKYYDDKLI